MPDIDTEVTGCCGLSAVKNFHMPCTCSDEDCDRNEDDTDFSSIADALGDDDHKGIIIATTNAEQENAGVGLDLIRNGFHAVLNTFNENSGNRITLWVRDHTERKIPVSLVQAAPDWVTMDAEIRSYIQANPNPRSASARRLVSKYRELFQEKASS